MKTTKETLLPLIQKLIKDNRIEIKNLANSRLTIEQLVNDVAIFLSKKQTLHNVENAYNKGRYDEFDPSADDDGCQTRPPIIANITKKSKVFSELATEDQLYLLLSHALRNYYSDVVDVFGNLLYDFENPKQVVYPSLDDSSNNAKPQRGVDSIKLMAQLTATLSKERLKDIADNISCINTLDSKDFINPSGLAQYSTTYGMVVAITNAIKEKQPLILRIKILSQDTSGNVYLKGHSIVMYLPTDDANLELPLETLITRSLKVATPQEAETYKDTPAFTMLGTVVLHDGPSTRSSGELAILDRLSICQTSIEYNSILQNPGLVFQLTLGMCINDDMSKERRDINVFANLPISGRIAEKLKTYDLSYTVPIKTDRKNDKGKHLPTYKYKMTEKIVPFNIYHCILDTFSHQVSTALELEESCRYISESISSVLPSYPKDKVEVERQKRQAKAEVQAMSVSTPPVGKFVALLLQPANVAPSSLMGTA